MSEMRMNEVVLAGRVVSNFVRMENGRVHFLFEATAGQPPFHCVAVEKTADNLMQYCEKGDEFSIEGKLCWMQFRQGRGLVVWARFASYGRKRRTLRADSYLA